MIDIFWDDYALTLWVLTAKYFRLPGVGKCEHDTHRACQAPARQQLSLWAFILLDLGQYICSLISTLSVRCVSLWTAI